MHPSSKARPYMNGLSADPGEAPSSCRSGRCGDRRNSLPSPRGPGFRRWHYRSRRWRPKSPGPRRARPAARASRLRCRVAGWQGGVEGEAEVARCNTPSNTNGPAPPQPTEKANESTSTPFYSLNPRRRPLHHRRATPQRPSPASSRSAGGTRQTSSRKLSEVIAKTDLVERELRKDAGRSNYLICRDYRVQRAPGEGYPQDPRPPCPARQSR